MNSIIGFGETVEGYDIPVLNEREIRASAGMLFVLMFVSIQLAATQGRFTLLKYAIILFLADILIRVFVNPRFAPTLILGRLIVRNQVPEYVGAKQKRFAWLIGIALAVTMLILQVIVNSFSPITGLICMTCLVFLFFEAAFGICLGCKVYSLVYKEKAQYCPGEVCAPKNRQNIQKTTAGQLLVVLGFIAFMVAIGLGFHDFFSIEPFDLFGLTEGAHSG